jgi:hypothetical protein
MGYQVSCECGRRLPVPGTAAGSRVPCRCGREVDVPALSALRREAGETSFPPEVLIEQLLLEGKLPEENWCACCEAETDHIVRFQVDCERVESREQGSAMTAVFTSLWLFFGWIAMVFARDEQTDERVLGKNVAFELPLRVCPLCSQTVRGERAIRSALVRVPLYSQLLKKYPHAKVRLMR